MGCIAINDHIRIGKHVLNPKQMMIVFLDFAEEWDKNQ
jgi:hypothetical protein